MRNGLRAGAAVLAFLLPAAPGLRADDAAPAAAPTMQDYQRPDALSPSLAPSGAPPDLTMPAPAAPSPAGSGSDTDQSADKNWLLKGVEAERQAQQLRQTPSLRDSSPTLRPGETGTSSTTPKIQTTPGARPGSTTRPKDAGSPGGTNPLGPTSAKPLDASQFKPLIKGLSTDATKPLATTGLSTNSGNLTALSQFKSVQPITPDVTHPLTLESVSHSDSSATALGTASSPAEGGGFTKLPSGYEIPNSPSLRPAGAVPAAQGAPMAPIAPSARPINSALSAFTPIQPIQPISVPTAPVAPTPPTARDIAPKAGGPGAVRLKDPVDNVPFIR